jgi:hypothetical protein
MGLKECRIDHCKYSRSSLIRIDTDAKILRTDYFYEIAITHNFIYKIKKDTKLRIK